MGVKHYSPGEIAVKETIAKTQQEDGTEKV
ncbi:hypothetical protein C874_11550 [Elizabethkingia anophelis 502]|nr:hypothetical protein C874_11550 [Elizabethkingia anophelis 502]